MSTEFRVNDEQTDYRVVHFLSRGNRQAAHANVIGKSLASTFSNNVSPQRSQIEDIFNFLLVFNLINVRIPSNFNIRMRKRLKKFLLYQRDGIVSDAALTNPNGASDFL